MRMYHRLPALEKVEEERDQIQQNDLAMNEEIPETILDIMTDDNNETSFSPSNLTSFISSVSKQIASSSSHFFSLSSSSIEDLNDPLDVDYLEYPVESFFNRTDTEFLVSFLNANKYNNISSSEVIGYSGYDISNSSILDLDDGTSKTVLPPFGLFMTVFIAVSISLCIIITVLGNLLVLTAFVVERTIRQPSNYFICSLAISDLIIGIVSMPVYAIYVLKGTWDMGPILCDLWLATDHTVCLVSIYTVLLITIDRYCSVKHPTKYRSWRTKKKVMVMVIVTWILPALIFFISIMGWEHFIGYRDLEEGECNVQFLKDPVFNTSLIFGYFYVTLLVLFILYAGIYRIASDMAKRSEQKQQKVRSLVALGRSAVDATGRVVPGLGVIEAEKLTGTGSKGPRESRASREASKGEGKGGVTKITNLEAIGSCDGVEDEESDDQDRSSSPVFESDDEDEYENYGSGPDIERRIGHIHQQTNVIKKGPRAVAPVAKKKSRGNDKKGHKTSRQETEMTTIKATQQLIPRSPVIAAGPTRIALPPDFVFHDEQLRTTTSAAIHEISPPSTTISTSTSGVATMTSASSTSQARPTSLEIQSSIQSPTASSSNLPPTAYQVEYGVRYSIREEDVNLTPPQTKSTSATGNVTFELPTSSSLTTMKTTNRPSKKRRKVKKSPTVQSPSGKDGQGRHHETEGEMTKESTSNSSENNNRNSSSSGNNNNKNSSSSPSTVIKGKVSTQVDSSGSIKVVATIPPDRQESSCKIDILDNKDIADVDDKEKTDKAAKSQERRDSRNGRHRKRKSVEEAATSDSGKRTSRKDSQDGNGKDEDDEKPGKKTSLVIKLSQRLRGVKDGVIVKGLPIPMTPQQHRAKSKSENRARKALRTISFILGAFVICWTPYHILALIQGFCTSKEGCVNHHLFYFTYFLCYANSPINPFCYAMANQQFKKTFYRILRGDLRYH